MASPRETSLVIWGSEGEGSRFKVSKIKVSFPSQITANNEIVKEDIPLTRAPVCETRQMKLKCAAVVSTSNINDYLQHVYEQ
jgi:hypothetical protein